MAVISKEASELAPAGLMVGRLQDLTCCLTILGGSRCCVIQSVYITLLGIVVPADMVEQHSFLDHQLVKLVKKLAAEMELLQLPQEEHLLACSLAAYVHVCSPFQPVVDNHSQVLVLEYDADLDGVSLVKVCCNGS